MDAAALAELLRRWLAGAQAPPQPLSEDVVRAASAHRLAGTLYHMQCPLSESAMRRCRSAWADALGAHLLRTEALGRIWPAWAPAPLVIKGADLAECLFDDPGARQARDLDLVVPQALFPRLVETLTPLGEVEWPRHERSPADRPWAVGLRIGPSLIEIHTALQPPHRGGPDGAMLWARGHPGRLGDQPVLYPRPVDRLLIWLVNMAKGAFYGDLADMLDLVMILRAIPDPGAAGDAARAFGLQHAWALACAQLARSGLGPGPPPPRWARALIHRLPSPLSPRVQPPAIRFQLWKWWLSARGQRLAVAWRLARSHPALARTPARRPITTTTRARR